MNPDQFRALGHRVVEMLAEYFEGVGDRPLFPDISPREVEALFDEPLPRVGMDESALLADVESRLLANCTHVSHPGYFGLITPSPLPIGIIGDFIASAINQNIGVYSLGPAAVAMERRVVRWLCDLAGYGVEAGGNLTSGGMMANFLAMKFARDFASGQSAQHDGVNGRLAAYTSEERHISVDKASDCVGIGRRGLRILPTDDLFRLRIDALERAIHEDKRSGVKPMCIVAMAGSTNTGAVDDLRALRAIADRENMWLHADAAYGGGMLISNRHPGALDGLHLADSITIDPHKWFYAPVDAGAVLVRDHRQLTRSFGMKPPYLTDEFDAAGERYQFYVHGFEQSRRFRGLKVWMAFKSLGVGRIGEWIDANIDQARRLYDLAENHPRFRAARPPAMSAVCIRYEPRGTTDEHAIGRIHHEVVRRIEQSGRFWFSTTMLKERWWFRINPVNIHTRIEHMDRLFDLLVAECAAVEGEIATPDRTAGGKT